MATPSISYPTHADGGPTLQRTAGKIGTPRLEPYKRLLSRLYEPLFLLHALGQTRGGHTTGPMARNELEASRRRFMDNLAYICDFDKGGISCTAIAIEDTEDCYKFWVSSNGEASTRKSAEFLRTVLTTLHQIEIGQRDGSDISDDETELLSYCVTFSRKRIAKEKAKLASYILRCQTALKEDASKADKMLSAWLDSILISPYDEIKQCRSAACAAANSSFMPILSAAAQREERKRGLQDKKGPFAGTRHYIGRLASRFAAHHWLLQDAVSLSFLLSRFKVCIVPPAIPVAPPEVDSHTTLPGMLNRLLRKDHPEREEIEQALINLDNIAGTLKKFISKFGQGQPMVHAEVHVLEHFFKAKCKFVENDRYIACSKPSCLCCKLYFQHHPGRMVVPKSHEKIWPNWSPPMVADFRKGDNDSNRQRDVLNKIIESLRADAVAQVLQCSQPSAWHADSQTGISIIDDWNPTIFDSQQSQTTSSSPSSRASDNPKSVEGSSETLGAFLNNAMEEEDSKWQGDDLEDDGDDGGVPI